MKPRRGSCGASRGFTLTELIVSMAVGTFVALGALNLSSRTLRSLAFESRAAETQQGVAEAQRRLREDIQRAGYMSTSQMGLDGRALPMVPAKVAADGVAKLAALAVRITPRSQNLKDLEKLQNVNPDELDIAGNLTTSDDFGVRQFSNPSTTVLRVYIMKDVALRRLRPTESASADNVAALSLAFKPRPHGANKGVHMARVTQRSTGCSYYYLTADEPVASDTAGPYVELLAGPSAKASMASSCRSGGPNLAAPFDYDINPVQWVRWSVDGEGNLSRTFLDARDLNPIPETREEILGGWGLANEAISVRAVNLKVGAVWNDPAQSSEPMSILEFDAPELTKQFSHLADASDGTRRVDRLRMLNVHLSARSGISERNAPMPELPTTNLASGASFCVDSSVRSLADCKQFVRVRHGEMQVALVNVREVNL